MGSLSWSTNKIDGHHLCSRGNTVRVTTKSLEILKNRFGVASTQLAASTPWISGIAGIIDTLFNEHGVDAASESAIEVSYRLIYAAYARLEGSDNDLASRIDAGLTQGAVLYMGDEFLREAGKGAKLLAV